MNKLATTTLASVMLITATGSAMASPVLSTQTPEATVTKQEWNLDLTKRFSRDTQTVITINETQSKPSKEVTPTTQIITEVEGTESMYTTSGLFLKGSGFEYGDYIASYVVTNGATDDIYLRHILPSAGMNSNVYIRGYYNEQEELWHLPSGQLVGTTSEGKDLYFGCVALLSDNTLYLMDDGLFEISEGFEHITQIAKSIAGQEYICCYDADGNVWGPSTQMQINKVMLTQAEAPENASKKTFKVSFDCVGSTFDVDPIHIDQFCEIATAGKDVYLRNFDYSMGTWIKGELKDNGDIYIPTEQLMGANGGLVEYLYIFTGEQGNLIETDGMTLSYNAAMGNYTSQPNYYLATGFAWYDISVHHWNYKLTPSVATHGKPQKPQIYDFIQSEGLYNIYVLSTSEVDENGDTMNPENMFVRVYHNGQPYMFDAETYNLAETTNELPYTWVSNMMFDNGEWTMMGRVYPGFWIVFKHDTDWVQFELVYKDGDQEYVSDRIDYSNYGLPFMKTPSAPENLNYDSETGHLTFDLNPVDADNTALNPDKLWWRLYVDDEPYLFTPNDYIFLFDYNYDADPIDLVAYYTLTWDDTMNDWWGNYETISIYLHPAQEYNNIAVEAVYLNEGQEAKSELTTLAATGIKNAQIDDNADCEYYTVDGKYIGTFKRNAEKNLTKGIYIKRQNGKSVKVII